MSFQLTDSLSGRGPPGLRALDAYDKRCGSQPIVETRHLLCLWCPPGIACMYLPP